MPSTVFSVSEAQAKLPEILRKHPNFTISRHGKPLGMFVSFEQLATLLETIEILEDQEAMKTIRQFQAGRLKLSPLK